MAAVPSFLSNRDTDIIHILAVGVRSSALVCQVSKDNLSPLFYFGNSLFSVSFYFILFCYFSSTAALPSLKLSFNKFFLLSTLNYSIFENIVN
jgi:hypothetical protein